MGWKVCIIQSKCGNFRSVKMYTKSDTTDQEMDENISFGTWLRQRRRALDLTQQTFADRVGCARITLSRIEADTLKPSKELAIILLEKVGIPPSEREPWVRFARGLSGLPSKASQQSTSIRTKTNLPASLTSFIGRENEIAEVKQALNEHRLVTLTGSGGTGKTRLSLQVAADLLEKFDHGVWFVELAPLTDPELIPQTILSTIGISEQLGKTPIEILKEYLYEKSILIVLDNCEHLIEASAKLANTLLHAAPNLKVMASSREALGVKGEASYPVPSLTLPDIKHLPVIEQLSQYEAVRLFIDRALLVAPHFDVDKNNAPFITQICYRLDGIPLAIELAAARVKVMSAEQISKRLDDRFHLLTGGARTSLPRQQTLRALIDWSYDLQSENERLLLRRLSVFAGGWTLEATEEICVGDSIDTYDVLDLLSQLVNKSLVVVIEHSQSGETRYRMLETIRQYAREKLLEAGGSETLRDRHLAYFVKLAKQAESELYTQNQIFWLDRLDNEVDNLRVALEWALARDVEAGLKLMVAPQLFWRTRGNPRELGDWLAQLLERYAVADSLRARALAIYCWSLDSQGDMDKACMVAEQSLQLARTLSDKPVEAFSLLTLGGVLGLRGDIRKGVPLGEESLALYKTLGDKWGQATATEWLCVHHNDPEQSKAYGIEGLRLHKELGNLSGIAYCLSNLAQRAYWGGDFSSSAQWLDEARPIFRKLGDEAGESELLHHFGNLAFWQSDYQQARVYYEESIVLGEKIGHYVMVFWTHIFLAYLNLREGDISQAREKFDDSLRYMAKVKNVTGIIFSIEGLASLNVNQGKPARAARLFAWADVMREKISNHRPPVEQAHVNKDIAACIAKMGEAAFSVAYEEGKKMSLDEAVAYALQET